MSAVVEVPAFSAAATRRDAVVGYAAIFLTVLIWAGFALSIRYISASPLAPADVALMRFGIPALCLLPFLPSRWAALRSVPWPAALMVVSGAGVPFFFMASAGGAATSAVHVGALIAGTVPISVTILTCLAAWRLPAGRRLRALVVIAAGVASLVVAAPAGVSPLLVGGAALLLGASLLWGAYTIGLRRAGLDAVGSTLLLTLPSLALLVLLMAVGVVPSNLGHFSVTAAMPFLLVQGLGAGLVASLTYVVAIRRLGAERSALIGSLAPALASILAVPLLGEQLTPTLTCGVVAITVGVVLSNRR